MSNYTPNLVVKRNDVVSSTRTLAMNSVKACYDSNMLEIDSYNAVVGNNKQCKLTLLPVNNQLIKVDVSILSLLSYADWLR